jgi:PAS domain S-box-containing protein
MSLVVQALLPLQVSGRTAGVLVVGSRLHDRFASHLARMLKVHVSFASPDGAWASSRPGFVLDEQGRGAVAAALRSTEPVFEYHEAQANGRMYLPVRIGGESLVVLIETDVSQSAGMLQDLETRQVLISALLLAAAIVLGTLFTWGILHPLVQLKRRAIAMTAAVTGQRVDGDEGNEVDSLVKVIDRTTAALTAANRELAARENEVRLVTDSLPLAVAYVDRSQRYRYVNQRFAQWWQRPAEDLVGRHVPDVIGETLYAEVRDQIATALNGESVSYEREHQVLDGRLLCYQSRLVPHRSEAGEVLGYYALVEDITERRQVETQTERARAFTSAVIDAMPSPVFVKDEQHVYIAVNDAMCEFTGKPRSELVGKSDYDLFPEHEADVFWAKDQEVFESGLPIENEESITDASGIAHWILTRKRGYTLPGGNRMLVGVMTDLTERRRVEIALRDSEAQANRLALVASRTQNAVIITDAAGRVEWVNDGFVRMTGYSLAEVAGTVPGRMLQTEQTDAATVARVAQCVAKGDPFQVELVNQAKDGRRYWLSIDAQPIRDQDGRLTNFIAIESDITERKQAEEELRQAKAAAEAASRSKSEFVANMSHEIRTPMNGVLGMTELLLDSDLSERQRRLAQTIRNSGEALLNIINDILDFSKIEAGRMELDCNAFDVRAVVEETAELLAARAHSKGIELACNIAAEVPPGLEGDAGRLRQVLTNLIGNAVKFTESGEVVVAVTKVADAADGTCMLEFSVCDTGIGMNAEAKARLFQPFSQADGTTTRRYGGTGLGLAISRQLVQLMGGRIALESEPGMGSRFWFQLRFKPSAALPEDTAASKMLHGLRVLIVEDNPTNAAILKHYTEAWGMSPVCVDRAEKALALLETTDFDLGLIDWKLPGLSGPELGARLRSGPMPMQPLVLLTSMTATDVARTSREAGFNAYLTKPVRRDELMRCLARVLGDSDDRSQVGLLLTQRYDARVLLVEDNAVNAEICCAMLATLGCTVETAVNGAEAVAMTAAERYELILMDCQMPVMDGFQATHAIRAREALSPTRQRVPIVALTANAMQGDRDRCLAAGMDSYLAKPFKRQQLEAILVQHGCPPLPRESVQAATTTTTAATTTTPTARLAYAGAAPLAVGASGSQPASERTDKAKPAVLDVSALATIRSLERPGSSDLLKRVIDRYSQDAPRLVETLRTAAANADAYALQVAAHTLKSASANVGAVSLAGMCKELEITGRNGAVAGAAAVLPALERELDRVHCALQAELARAAGR